MTRDEIREIVMDCLKDYGVAKAIKRKKAVPEEPTVPVRERAPTPFGIIADAWADAMGVPPMGRLAKALTPLLAMYNPEWIAKGIQYYAAEAHRENSMRYTSPEHFAGRASGYILPAVPSNELTEAEAALIGMTESREHMATLGLLTDRARG